jgi:hypothetical protein
MYEMGEECVMRDVVVEAVTHSDICRGTRREVKGRKDWEGGILCIEVGEKHVI